MVLSHQRKVALFSLLFYWPALFVLAHIPIPLLVREAGVSDKSLHFLAYLILVFLLWFAISGDKKVNWRKGTAWWVLFIVGVYAVFDEWLQGYVAGRSCDVRDFFADLTGMLTGLILLAFFTFWPAGLLIAGTVIFGITNIARVNLADLLPVTNAMFHLFGYAFFTLLWIQYMLVLHVQSGYLQRTKLKLMILSLAVPTGFLLTVKLSSTILGKDFAAQDIILAIVGIVTVVAIKMLIPFQKAS